MFDGGWVKGAGRVADLYADIAVVHGNKDLDRLRGIVGKGMGDEICAGFIHGKNDSVLFKLCESAVSDLCGDELSNRAETIRGCGDRKVFCMVAEGDHHEAG
jgi:hypothetical protein